MVCRGEIWLVNLNPSKKPNEMSKVRPVVVFQNNELNHSDYPTTIIIPLSTSLVDDTEPLRMRISKREDLLASENPKRSEYIEALKKADNRDYTDLIEIHKITY
jgi:mRNA-degrading endonuclease toxin of MazEF toxin-antitoxin module